jgi:hypothetical protein
MQWLRAGRCGISRHRDGEEEMSEKTRRSGAKDEGDGLEVRSRQIRSDLERRGVAPELSLPAAQRLSAIAPDLSPKEYGAVLDGVAAAYLHSDGEQPQVVGDVGEIQRLMEGFTGELRKLEEGLQILSAYVVRMGSRAHLERPTTLH